MRYVLRNAQGAVTSVHAEWIEGSEALPAGHPEVQAFVRQEGPPQEVFAGMDADLVRVLEDLIDALIERNVLRITDLPASAQAKLFDRKHFRQSIKDHALSLYTEGQDVLGSDGVLSTEALSLHVPRD